MDHVPLAFSVLEAVRNRTDRPVPRRRPWPVRPVARRVTIVFSATLLIFPDAVDRVKLTPCALPFAKPYVTVRGRIERREIVFVASTDSGGCGLGEAFPLSLHGGERLCPGAGGLGKRPAS